MKDDFINSFRKASKHLDTKAKQTNVSANTPEVEIAKNMINAYRETYADVDINVLRNLIELKDITREPKKSIPDDAFLLIKKRLGTEESKETLHNERWHGKVICPNCNSKNIKLLSTKEYKYLCLECQENFNDATGTPLETGTPPLSTWMFCWYLLGCTDSLQYIAAKLGLDLATVELMVRQMQKMFKSQQPLTNFMTFEEWSLKHGKSYKERIKHEMHKQQELHTGENPNAPKDTAEYRRQKERARHKPKNRGV